MGSGHTDKSQGIATCLQNAVGVLLVPPPCGGTPCAPCVPSALNKVAHSWCGGVIPSANGTSVSLSASTACCDKTPLCHSDPVKRGRESLLFSNGLL